MFFSKNNEKGNKIYSTSPFVWFTFDLVAVAANYFQKLADWQRHILSLPSLPPLNPPAQVFYVRYRLSPSEPWPRLTALPLEAPLDFPQAAKEPPSAEALERLNKLAGGYKHFCAWTQPKAPLWVERFGGGLGRG